MHNLVQRQVHHHTRSCKKNKNKNCRFNYPKAPSPQTMIARVFEGENSSIIKTEASFVLQKVHAIVASPDSGLGGIMTLDALLQKAGVSRKAYVSSLQVTQRRTIVIMKRTPQKLMVNNYNKSVTSVKSKQGHSVHHKQLRMHCILNFLYLQA